MAKTVRSFLSQIQHHYLRSYSNATLKTYPGFPHGLPTTNAEQNAADLLAFIRS